LGFLFIARAGSRRLEKKLKATGSRNNGDRMGTSTDIYNFRESLRDVISCLSVMLDRVHMYRGIHGGIYVQGKEGK
jgi:hypothetical protein